MRARMTRIQMQMKRKKHRNPMVDQRRMCSTEGIVGLTWKPVMLTGVRARLVTMRMLIRRMKHHKPMMDQH
jgi:hypothetical protein